MNDVEFPLPCIVCGHKPELVFPGASPKFPGGEVNWQPSGATTFTSTGQYGSTVFDDDGGYLMVNVCDPCMREKAKAGIIAHAHPQRPRPVSTDYEAWAPYEPEGDE